MDVRPPATPSQCSRTAKSSCSWSRTAATAPPHSPRPCQRSRAASLRGSRGDRRALRDRSIVPRIARRGAVRGSSLGRTRWVVERSFSWLHQFEEPRIRHEVRADLHSGLLQLACVLT